jgi:hypothetical protein
MLALVHVEKTGGKTICRVMRREHGMRHCDVLSWSGGPVFGAADYRRLRWLYPRLQSISGHAVRPYSDLAEARPDVRYYTILRNPLERCAAHYNMQVVLMGKTLSFEEWISEPRYRNRQTCYLAGKDDPDAAIEMLRTRLFFVGLSHHYDESMVILQKRIGDPRIRLDFPRYDARGSGRWRRLLFADPAYKRFPDDHIARRILSDPKQRALLEEANRSDSRVFEFVTRELFPRQIQEYGPSFAADLAAFRAREERGVPSPAWLMNRVKRNLVYKPALWAYRKTRA